MRNVLTSAATCVVCLASCDFGPMAQLPEGYCDRRDMKSSTQDMPSGSAKCAAAKGLPGDNLICVDFSSIPDGPLGSQLPAKLNGWDFVSNCGGMYWEISNGKLGVKMFSSFSSFCGVLMPGTDLTTAANQRYNSITLSIIHKADLSDPEQYARVFLSTVDAKDHLLFQTNGHQPRQQTVVTLARADLPQVVKGMFQPLLLLDSSTGAGMLYKGWLIESIAINASP